LSEWLKQLAQPNQGAAAEAARALEEARYWVDQAPQVVAALAERIPSAKRELLLAIVRALTRFGPIARSAVAPVERAIWNDRTGYFEQRDDYLAALVLRIRCDRQSYRHWGELSSLWPSSGDEDRQFRIHGRDLSFGRIEVGRAALAAGAHAPLTLLRVAEDYLAFLRMHVAEDLDLVDFIGSAAQPLQDYFVYSLSDRVKERRGAVLALAGCAGLAPSDVLKVLEEADALSDGQLIAKVVRRIAIHQVQPADSIVAFLRRRVGVSHTATSAWAQAGLARLAPDAKTQLPFVQKCLAHEDAWVRAGGLEALRHLGAAGAPLHETVIELLEDHDMRPRWRAGAVLLAAGRRVETAAAAVATALDGPDDEERLQALKVVAAAGALALPLNGRLLSTQYVFGSPLYAEEMKALEAIARATQAEPK
jgi:hypothetical protein